MSVVHVMKEIAETMFKNERQLHGYDEIQTVGYLIKRRIAKSRYKINIELEPRLNLNKKIRINYIITLNKI